MGHSVYQSYSVQSDVDYKRLLCTKIIEHVKVNWVHMLFCIEIVKRQYSIKYAGFFLHDIQLQ